MTDHQWGVVVVWLVGRCAGVGGLLLFTDERTAARIPTMRKNNRGQRERERVYTVLYGIPTWLITRLLLMQEERIKNWGWRVGMRSVKVASIEKKKKKKKRYVNTCWIQTVQVKSRKWGRGDRRDCFFLSFFASIGNLIIFFFTVACDMLRSSMSVCLSVRPSIHPFVWWICGTR